MQSFQTPTSDMVKKDSRTSTLCYCHFPWIGLQEQGNVFDLEISEIRSILRTWAVVNILLLCE